jgi:hypothetical protein
MTEPRLPLREKIAACITIGLILLAFVIAEVLK